MEDAPFEIGKWKLIEDLCQGDTSLDSFLAFQSAKELANRSVIQL